MIVMIAAADAQVAEMADAQAAVMTVHVDHVRTVTRPAVKPIQLRLLNKDI